MGNLKWKPARTGDPLINRNFDDLASKLSGIDDVIEALDLPDVSRHFGDATVKNEDYIDYRGKGGHSIQLCPADDNGPGRARVVYVANNGSTSISVKAQGKQTINGLTAVSLAAGSMLLAVSDGASSWRALVTANSVARAGHVIQDNGTDKTQRNHLNIIGATIADDSVNDATVVTLPGASQAGHIIQDHEVDQTQRLHLDFATGAVCSDVSASDRTKVEIRFPDYDGIFLAGSWYAAPVTMSPVAATTAVSVGASSGDTGFLWCYPVYFGRDCTINKLGQRHSGGTGSGGCKSWQAIYSANTAGDGPDQRLADFEQVSTGFGSHSETTINLSVKAGTVLWFAITLNANEASNGYPRVGMEMMRVPLGTNYDGAGGSDFTFRLGYKPAFTYGQPPSTWSGTTKLVRVSSGLVPAILYTVTPS